MTKYRFKTEQEFIEEYGGNWRDADRNGHFFSNGMDRFLGTEIDDKHYKETKNGDFDLNDKNFYFRIYVNTLSFGIKMFMIKNNNVINYNEKKTLVYD